MLAIIDTCRPVGRLSAANKKHALYPGSLIERCLYFAIWRLFLITDHPGTKTFFSSGVWTSVQRPLCQRMQDEAEVGHDDAAERHERLSRNRRGGRGGDTAISARGRVIAAANNDGVLLSGCPIPPWQGLRTRGPNHGHQVATYPCCLGADQQAACPQRRRPPPRHRRSRLPAHIALLPRVSVAWRAARIAKQQTGTVYAQVMIEHAGRDVPANTGHSAAALLVLGGSQVPLRGPTAGSWTMMLTRWGWRSK
jgi:hypothetical protein